MKSLLSKSLLVFFVVSLLMPLAFCEKNREYLPYFIQDGHFHVLTDAIPEKLSVTVRCLISHKGGQSLSPDVYLYVYPREENFTSIVQEKSYIVDDGDDEDGFSQQHTEYYLDKTGGKLYRHDTEEDYFLFWVNGVDSHNREILIASRRIGASSLDIGCSY